MRMLLVSPLAATLIGCTCLGSPQATMNGCTDAKGFACLDETAAGPRLAPKPTAFRSDPVARAAMTIAAKTTTPSAAEFGTKADPVTRPGLTVAAKTADSPSGLLGAESDPVTRRAKSAIAARLEDSASAEFGEMKRAVRKNTNGKPIDSICGYVKSKAASGGGIEEKPFLYLVQEDEAYIVDSSDDGSAAIAYQDICS